MSSGSLGGGFGGRGDRDGLIQSYDEENGGFGLHDLAEDSEEEGQKRRSMNGKPRSVEMDLKEVSR